MLNNLGDYVIFPSSIFHRGYLSIHSNSIYYTAQMFAIPSGNISRSSTSARNSIMMTSQIKNTMTFPELKMFSDDVLQNWNNPIYTNKKFNPPKRFDGKKLNPSYHRHIKQKHFHILPILNHFIQKVETMLGFIQIDSIWIMAKCKENNGFQEWHQDKLGLNVTTTIVVNIGIQIN